MAFTPRIAREILALMQLDRSSRPLLNGLDSTSETSVTLNLMQMFANATELHEAAFASFQQLIEVRADQLPVGRLRWYGSESLIFQYGDSLQHINGNLTYSVIDASKRIIQLAAADIENGFIVIKVAALDGQGIARPLTAMELTAFTAFWRDYEIAGSAITIVSLPPDLATINYRIGVDATFIDPSTGQLLSDPTQYPVETAIQNYLRTFQSVNFNSLITRIALTDAIQSVPGVRNAIAQDVQIMPANGTAMDVLATENDEYIAAAGYAVVNPADTLRTTLSYYNAN